MMPANDEDHLGEQFRLYHGTPWTWKPGQKPSGSYDAYGALHVDTDPHDFPEERAFGDFHTASEPQEAWDAARSGRVMEFKLRPGAKVHFTDTPHADAVLPDEEMEHVKRQGFDMTLFPKSKGGHYGVVYNPDAIEHVKSHKFEDITRRNLEDEMDWQHGEDWREWVHR
jgi:hypothetical protein